MNENKPLVSVIVPVYRVESYLGECIESIIGQSYRNIEVILVDDGSPDRSGAICDEYAAADSRVKVIHKKNGGVSAARLDGFLQTSGEWVTFVDSDDTLPSDAVYTLLKNASAVDCVVGKFDLNTENYPPPFCCENGIDAGEVVRHYLRFERRYRWELCGKLHRKALLSEAVLKVERDIRVFEDYIISLRYMLGCNRVRYVDNVVYNYRMRDDSSTHEFVFTLQYAKAISRLTLEALGGLAEKYSTELRMHYGFLLTTVIGSEELRGDDEWLSQVERITTGGAVSLECRLAMALAKHCRYAWLRRMVMACYRGVRRIAAR